ncbi:chemotaxis protein CheW [Salipiger mangrovisoli]|uniref:Chemotaxis protein CheW n=1 Tax=Salipiger mangrovisoli TaxID=2865933 RepID=A0ABR9WYG3_9RHOB|nr:chemotaxis protein CheW [Salipiger mangrovisoli]MBE9636323.1 chemotaxis protein CheW [Salipiger mangrovisoli]
MRAETVVTFAVADSLFAVEVRSVQEILSARVPTRLPNAPSHLLGLIDVRGTSVALVDLRSLLGEAARGDDENTRILMLTIDRGSRTNRVALRVDRVIEVAALDHDGAIAALEEAEMVDWDQRILKGVGRRNDEIVVLLDIGAVFDPQLMGVLRTRGRPADMLPCPS